MKEYKTITTCDKCGVTTEKELTFTARISLGNYHLHTIDVCDDCLEENLGIPRERLAFMRQLAIFRRHNRLSSYQRWDELQEKAFVAVLKAAGIENRNYGIEIWKGSGDHRLKRYKK